ncbi:MAG: FAD binding domain-containing protein, partial [Ilumatobacteraceae bacterium]
MIPAPFEHIVASSVADSVAALEHYGEDAKLLAGGHSLIPLMKLRLATPSTLIDIMGISELKGIRREGDFIVIGALTRHVEVERSPIVIEHAPLISAAAALVGDPQVRNRGTIGGSVAHGDSASDLSCALLAAGAEFVVTGPSGTRSIPASEFFVGFWTTALEPSDVMVEIRVPCASRDPWSYQKFTIRSQDWAVVSVALSGSSIVLGAMGETPLRATATEQALASGASPAEAAERAADGTSPSSDLRASADYMGMLGTVITAL